MALDDIYDDGRESISELLAEGEYESSRDQILHGFKIFQKKYVYKTVAIQMTLVILAIATQLVNVFMGTDRDVSFSWMLIVMCVVLGGYLLMRPKNTYKKLEAGLNEIEGTVYKAEIYTDNIKISTIYDPYIKKEEEEKSSENSDNNSAEEKNEEDELPPATVIHLDNSAVEIVECSEIYLVYVKKVNIFVVPKSAFKPYENMEIKNRFSNIMGVRYKEN